MLAGREEDDDEDEDDEEDDEDEEEEDDDEKDNDDEEEEEAFRLGLLTHTSLMSLDDAALLQRGHFFTVWNHFRTHDL